MFLNCTLIHIYGYCQVRITVAKGMQFIAENI